jgi:hypothetical protein
VTRALQLLLVLVSTACVALATPASAQARKERPSHAERPDPPAEIAVSPRERPVEVAVTPGTGELNVRLGDALGGSVATALQSGLPVRLRVLGELWRDRLFDSEESRAEWRATVIYEPLERTYRVQVSGADSVRTLATLRDVNTNLAQSLRLPLRPTRRGKFYYIAQVELETLSLSDLEELRRWLRGDLAPAVAGDEDVHGALAKGMNRLLVRVLGVPARRVRLRTPAFEWEPPAHVVERGPSPE